MIRFFSSPAAIVLMASTALPIGLLLEAAVRLVMIISFSEVPIIEAYLADTSSAAVWGSFIVFHILGWFIARPLVADYLDKEPLKKNGIRTIVDDGKYVIDAFVYHSDPRKNRK